MDARKPTSPIKGRGAASRVAGRFERTTTIGADDGWGSVYDEEVPRLQTTVTEERARTIISRNKSPDVGFSQSVNPFRGCEHGCVYCFARPSHSYLGLSPGLDFETKLVVKANAAEQLRRELASPGYVVSPIALGINTDSYQPIEKRYRVTRSVLQVLAECKHPVSFVTKSALITRDLDVLTKMAEEHLVSVYLSVTTLDNKLSSKLEPRASAPHTRLKTIQTLREAGIPVGILIAPVIPMITDSEMERILEATRAAGAESASYVLLRLPYELKEMWREWLELHYPDRANHVMSVIQQMHGGKDYDSTFGTRMKGQGPFADLLAQRFRKAHARLSFGRLRPLDCSKFRRPVVPSAQGQLF